MAQEKAAVDFTHLDARLQIFPEQGKVEGQLLYSFDVNQETDSVFIDARKMAFQEVLLNGKSVEYLNNGKQLILVNKLPKLKNNRLQISYSATPGQAMYFIQTETDGKEPSYQVWTQGQGKYTSNWLPSFDDTNEKLEFDLQVDYKKGKTVVANGELEETVQLNDSVVRWKYNMTAPMSSYLVAVAAGDLEKKELQTKNGTEMLFYYPPQYEQRFEPTYRYSEEIMNYFEKEIGLVYPWKNYKQVPVREFLYAGMENTGTTIFSDSFLVDSIGFNDRNYVNVNAHELAHQWFGDLVTAESGDHHWLQEGFATYYALLAEKVIFGDDYYYWKLFRSAEELKELSDSGKGESLLDPNASSLTFYQKGAWALHILKELVGKGTFDEAVKNYLEKNKFGNVTTADFLNEVEKVSDVDLTEFKKNWLQQSAFQGTEALESLKRSPFIMDYLEIAALKQLPLSEKKQLLEGALNFPVQDYVGQEVVYQLSLEDPYEAFNLYKKAFASNNLYVRQAIALSLQQIPQALKTDYESLLNDDSYVTIQAALLNLWMNFKEDRLEYLKMTEGIDGFLDKNVRIAWLALSMATPEISSAQKKEYFQELNSYTDGHQRFQVRQNAFDFLYQLGAFTDESLQNLQQATTHHNYRFREYAKAMLKTLKESGSLSEAQLEMLEN
ncbi:M1 family metallopeptidase [Actinomadura fibrosa]